MTIERFQNKKRKLVKIIEELRNGTIQSFTVFLINPYWVYLIFNPWNMSHLGAMTILRFYLCNSYYAGSAVHHKMKRASDCDAAWTSSVDRQRFLMISYDWSVIVSKFINYIMVAALRIHIAWKSVFWPLKVLDAVRLKPCNPETLPLS